MRTRNIVDETALLFVVTNKTQRHAVAQRDIDETFSEVTNITTFWLLHTEADATLKHFGARLIRDDSDCARLSVRTVSRTLRTRQYFDTVNIVNVRVHVLTHGRNRLLI